jgi:pyruvate formate lyase activating enzyme
MEPPEKNPLRALVTNIQGFSTEDGPGIRTTVFFKGCPLACPWCHNPEGLVAKEELIFYADKCIGCKECTKVCEHGAPVPGGPGFDQCVRCFKCVETCPATARRKMGEWYTVDRLVAQVLRDRVYYETSGGGVTASGGEAMIWAEFIAAFFQSLKAESIHTALDTSAVVGGDKLDSVLQYTDLALVDLKIMDPERHRAVIGVELPPILDHIRRIDAFGTPMFIRVPVVPGFTDDPANVAAIAQFARSLKNLKLIDLLPYHRMAEPKYRHLGKTYSLPDLKPPTADSMESIKRALASAGLKVAIAGKD